MPFRLATQADAPRLLVVAQNDKVAAHTPHPWTPNADLIQRVCFGVMPNGISGNPTRTAVVTNASDVVMGWMAGSLWYEADQNDNGDGITLVHHRYVSINRLCIHTSVPNNAIIQGVRDAIRTLMNYLDTINVTDMRWPLMLGSICTQTQSDLAQIGDALPTSVTDGTLAGRLFTGLLSDWRTKYAALP